MRLRGHLVVVTRARHQAGELAEALEAEGAEVLEIPAITIAAPEDPAALARAIDRWSTFDLVALTSRNTVEAVLEVAARRGVALGATPIAAVGAKTAAALRAHGLEPVIVPGVYRAEALVGAIGAALGPLEGRRVLVPRADEGREILIDALRGAGAEVEAVTAYRLVEAPPAPPESLARLARATAATFLSGKTLEHFLTVVPEDVAREFLRRAVVAVIGPVAAETAARLGIRVDVVPGAATVESLVEALAARLASGPQGG